MGATAELFIRMSEEEYFAVPEEVRQRHLQAKIYNQSVHDFAELMQDPTYAKLYKEKKKVSKDLDERQYYLREQKRKQLNP